MHVITYLIDFDARESEKQYLKECGVFPVVEKAYIWDHARNEGVWKNRVGAIVDDQTLLALTLRVKIESKKLYVQGRKQHR